MKFKSLAGQDITVGSTVMIVAGYKGIPHVDWGIVAALGAGGKKDKIKVATYFRHQRSGGTGYLSRKESTVSVYPSQVLLINTRRDMAMFNAFDRALGEKHGVVMGGVEK